MARFRDAITAFTGGEVSPRAYGRSELPQYKQACEIVENMIVYPQGGAGRRPGTQLVTALNDKVDGTFNGMRVIPFSISRTQSYAVVLTTKVGSPASIANGLFVWSVNGAAFQSVTHSYSSEAYTQHAGYSTQAQLNEIQYAQFGNTLFFAQKDHIPWALEYRSGSFFFMPFWAWSRIGLGGALVSSEVAKAWPFEVRNTSAVTLTADAAAATSLSYSSGSPSANRIGSLIRMTGDSAVQTGVALITAVGAGNATVTTLVNFEDTNPSSNWSYAAWSNFNGYPATISFFENRLFLGGTSAFPNVVWASRINNLADFRQEHLVQEVPNTVTNDDPWDIPIASSELNILSFLSAGKTLVAGTAGREYLLFGPDNTLAMGPLNYNVSDETAIGSKQRQPLRLDSALMFIQRSGRRLREFTFNFDENAYKTVDNTKLAEHIVKRVRDFEETQVDSFTSPEFENMCLQNSDDPIIWLCDRNGGLIGLTRDRDAEVSAFHYHRLGGFFNDGVRDRAPFVASICVIPSSDGTHDDVYMAVRRNYVDGVTKPEYVTLEKMGRLFDLNELDNDGTTLASKPVFMDCTQLALGPDTISQVNPGLLQGSDVDLLADGQVYQVAAEDTADPLPEPIDYDQLLIGFNYRAILKPLNLNNGSVIGSSQAAPKSVDTLTVRFSNSAAAKYGYDMNDLRDFLFREQEDSGDDPIELFTGDKEVSFPEGWQERLCVIIVSDAPLPMNVECIIARGLLND